MNKLRHTKMLSIIALVIAVTAMTIGFAAFSATLTISSSATVTPNSEDFEIVIYGFKDKDSINSFVENGFTLSNDYLSDSVGAAYEEGNTTTEIAKIDNTSHSISNIKVYLNKNNKAVYLFVLKNEGEYDAYLDLSDFQSVEGQTSLASFGKKTCTPIDVVNPDLLKKACDGILGIFGIYDTETQNAKVITENYYKIPAGGYTYVGANIEYYGPYADGDFDVTFDDYQFKFSTTQ